MRNFMQEGGRTIDTDLTLYNPKLEAVVVLGWAKSISHRSKSESLVAISYKDGKYAGMYYLCRPSEAYEWTACFGVSRETIDKILKREICTIRIIPTTELGLGDNK